MYYIISRCGIGVIFVAMYSDRCDFLVPIVTDYYIWLRANTVRRARDVRPVFGPLLGQRSERWVGIGPALVVVR